MNTLRPNLSLKWFTCLWSVFIWASVNVFAAPAPSITTQPQNQTIPAGSNVTFSVVASGQTPLTYQWSLSGTNLTNSAHINGAITNILTISNVVASDAGNYRVIVSNSHGTATSSNAPLTVLTPPVVAWGDNTYGQTNIPSAFTNAVTISSQGYTVEYLDLGLKSDGTVAAWGHIYISGAGDSNFGQTNLPVGLSNVVAVSAGFRHGLALKGDNSIVGLGDDSFDQATPPPGLSNVVNVSAGGLYSLALKNNGTVVGWGYDSQGAATPPIGLSNVVAIAAGVFHSLAIKNDGTVVGWGYNTYGQRTAPVGLISVVAVSAGSHHSLALKSDGTVVAWGYNYYGQADVPIGLSNVIAIAAGYYHSLALKSDGTVVAWGNNDYGQASPPSGLMKVVGIAAGNSHSVALIENPAAQVPPSIRWQGSTNRTVPSGQTAIFLPFVTGSLPLNFKWYFSGTQLPGQTNRWLALNSIQPNQAGNYQFIVANNYGSATGQVVVVSESPGIVTQPAGQSVLIGGTANFSAAAIGIGPLNYQWYFNGIPLSDGGGLSGSTTTNLNISNVQTNRGGSYQLVVTNNYGSATSEVASLSVLIPAAITVQPSDQSVLLNSNVILAATTIGTDPLSYQWYFKGSPMTNGARINGANSATLSISSVQTNDGGSYQLVVTNDYGLDTSATATLAVLVPAAITSHPSNQSVLLSSNATFSASANGTLPLSYKWYFNNAALSDGGRFTGSTTANLNISNVQTNDAGSYRLVVTNNYGSATSVAANLTVLVPPMVTSPPADRILLTGSNATFTVITIGTAPLSYTWYSNGTALTNGGRIGGATSAELTISNAQTNDGGSYHVIVTNSYGGATSSIATLTVIAPAQIIGHPASQAVLFGNNASFTVSATGTALSYQWYLNGTPLVDGGRVNGSGTPTLSVANVQSADGGGYVVVVTNLLSATASRTASLTPLTSLSASARYVNVNNTNPVSPYLDWNTAATNIQDAIDAAVAGDFIRVTNGNYSTGGRAVYGVATNRVTVDKPVLVQSVNGPSATTIMGIGNRGTPGIRCAYLTNGAALIGFTLTNGATRFIGDVVNEQSGGGLWCEGSSAIVSNCVIAGNYGNENGGGTFRGTLFNCTLTNNLAKRGAGACSNSLFNCVVIKNFANLQAGGVIFSSLSNCLVVGNLLPPGNGNSGGGAAFSVLTGCVVSNNAAALGNGGGLYFGSAENCLISSNYASAGGGAYSNSLVNCILKNNNASNGGGSFGSALVNCTIVSNVAGNGFSSGGGGGISGGTANNCIVYNNLSGKGSNFSEDPISPIMNNSCTTPLNTRGSGNFTYSPSFANLIDGDFHLQPDSPCINAGNNSYITNTTDFDGSPRIVGGTVDVGAYEFQTPSSVLSYAFAQQFGLPTDGSVDFIDSDGDGLNNWQEWRSGTNPTNAFSVLKLLSPPAVIVGRAVYWQSVSNLSYFVERSTNLSLQPPFSILKSNIVGQSGMTLYTDTNAMGAGPYFYRVGVQ